MPLSQLYRPRLLFPLGFILALLLVVAWVVPGSESRPDRRPRSILLVGWDGTQRTRLHRLLREGHLPNLQRLLREGSLLDLTVRSGKTETKPGWAEILTGYGPELTGVYNNRRRYRPIPEGLTIFERLEKHFGDDGIETVLLSGKLQNLGTRAVHRVWPEGPRKVWFDETLWSPEVFERENILTHPGEPFHLAHKHLDVFHNGLLDADRVGPRVLENLRRCAGKRFFLFVQFEEPDEQGHVYGEDSPQYSNALALDDLWLGRILDLLRELKLQDETFVYVVADHGFMENQRSHRRAPDTFLATNDPAIDAKEAGRKDLTPTLLWRYGLDPRTVAPPLEGRVLSSQGPELLVRP